MATLEAQSYLPLILERLEEINPTKVILFGSQAQGSATTESDLDLLVVTSHNKMPQNHSEKEAIYLEVARLLRDIRSQVSVDLVVHTRPMYARFIEMNSLFAKELLQDGVVLYESDQA